MNLNELMVGDWVEDTYRNKFVQWNPRLWFMEINGHMTDRPVEGRDYKPILLTTEILEKNGFVPIRQNAVEPYYWQYFDKNDGSIVNAFRRIYRGLWIECSNATTEASTNKQCEFVHELQHVIRNTEIEMEVVLC